MLAKQLPIPDASPLPLFLFSDKKLALGDKGSFYNNNKGLLSQGNIELEKDISFISELKGLFFKNPLLSFSLIVSLFSMAGIPPLIGFFSKQLVFYSALQNGYYFLSLFSIIVSVISCSYYLQIVKVLLTKLSVTALPYPYSKTNNNFYTNRSGSLICESKGDKGINKLTNTHSYLIAILTLTNLFFFIKPSLILNSTQLLSLSLFYI